LALFGLHHHERDSMTPKNRRWILSDSHLGHSNIQKHCRRPADVDKRFTDACKRLIGPEDLVIHLGDVAFGFFDLKSWFTDMPGNWILIRGNHDAHTISWYMNNGFKFACDSFVMGGVYFTHKPAFWLPEGCSINVHGHLHNRVAADHRVFPHCRLFALEHTRYEPMLLEKFLRKGCPGGVVLPQDGEPL
jgi:calcineurin-like phosphoesterase family protein